MSNQLITIQNVRGFIDNEGTARLNLEDVARGLGFTTVATSGNECVRWARVGEYLIDLGYRLEVEGKITPACGHDGYVPENIFYRLAMKAKNETAERFQTKVADEILPTIRKTGSYSVKVPKTFAEALRLAADLEEERQKLLPKAESFDTFMNSAGNLSIEETAKTLNIPGVGRNKLFDILVFRSILFKSGNSYRAYQDYVNGGYFVHKQVPVKKGDTIEQRTQVFVTPKGLDWLSRKLKRDEPGQLSVFEFKA